MLFLLFGLFSAALLVATQLLGRALSIRCRQEALWPDAEPSPAQRWLERSGFALALIGFLGMMALVWRYG